jgi:hypothetical protein
MVLGITGIGCFDRVLSRRLGMDNILGAWNWDEFRDLIAGDVAVKVR